MVDEKKKRTKKTHAQAISERITKAVQAYDKLKSKLDSMGDEISRLRECETILNRQPAQQKPQVGKK